MRGDRTVDKKVEGDGASRTERRRNEGCGWQGGLNKGLHVDGMEKRGQARGMKKEILIAWQVRLFRNIQRRCTECVPPSPTFSPCSRGLGARRVETPLARMVSAVSCIP